MSNFWKYLFIGLAVIIGGWFAIGLVIGLTKFILSIAVPVLIVAGVGYVVYRFATRDKSLPGSGKPLP